MSALPSCRFAALVAALWLGSSALADEVPRGGGVAWARLQTHSTHWNRGRDTDLPWLRVLARCTTLNIQVASHTADVNDLSDLCAYPYILAYNMTELTDAQLANLREYLLRGGFLVMDASLNQHVITDREGFVRQQSGFMLRALPNARIEIVPPSHPMFSIVFPMTEFPPQARANGWEPINPLRAVYVGDRMVGVISISGFVTGLGGWSRYAPADDTAKMLVNLYVYAVLR